MFPAVPTDTSSPRRSGASPNPNRDRFLQEMEKQLSLYPGDTQSDMDPQEELTKWYLEKYGNKKQPSVVQP
jgi:hypothetical protein